LYKNNTEMLKYCKPQRPKNERSCVWGRANA
jgi:hypothetical protein